MHALRRGLGVSVVTSAFAVGCARSPETVVHFSAPQGPSWEVREADGAWLCALPCSVELDENEAVTVRRSDGRTRFVVHQDQLGEGAFSGSIQARRRQTAGIAAARVFAAALAGAGSALIATRDRHAAAGVFLSGVGAAAHAATDAWRTQREELWVQRSANAGP